MMRLFAYMVGMLMFLVVFIPGTLVMGLSWLLALSMAAVYELSVAVLNAAADMIVSLERE
jgi:hypothetical protein